MKGMAQRKTRIQESTSQRKGYKIKKKKDIFFNIFFFGGSVFPAGLHRFVLFALDTAVFFGKTSRLGEQCTATWEK